MVEQPVSKDPFVTFNKDLYDKLTRGNIDPRLVQYYIDQQLVLTRYLDNGQIGVKNGVIKMSSGKYVNEIVIPAYTPVLLTSIESDGFRVAAESGGSTLKFLNSPKYSPQNFIFNPDKWNKDGQTEVFYDQNNYSVVCTSCPSGSANEAKLVVKQSTADQINKQTRVLPGMKIGGDFGSGKSY